MKNYSRQRETILQVLYSTDTHPTASAVYNEVRKVIPNISLGTVYRNLAALSEEGVILSLSVGDGYEHFDGNSAPHAHLHCKRCGKIYDAPLKQDILSETAKETTSQAKQRYISCTVCAVNAELIKINLRRN